jgi:hypothetical protein
LYEKEAARLTITGNDKAKHFKKAEAFVATTPDLPSWRITALEDPCPLISYPLCRKNNE